MSKGHYFFMSLLVIICVKGTITAYGYGVASVNFYNAKNTITKWRENSGEISIGQYQQAKANMATATKFHPNNALYHDLTGQIDEWAAIFELEDAGHTLSSAKESYRQATQLRPLWPVTWTSLVMIKWRLQEFDDEMLFFLRQADTLGSKNAEVNIVYAELGLALYRNNHPLLLNIRETFHLRLAKGLVNPYSRQKVTAIIKQYNAEALVCRWLRNDAKALKSLIPNCKS